MPARRPARAAVAAASFLALLAGVRGGVPAAAGDPADDAQGPPEIEFAIADPQPLEDVLRGASLCWASFEAGPLVYLDDDANRFGSISPQSRFRIPYTGFVDAIRALAATQGVLIEPVRWPGGGVMFALSARVRRVHALLAARMPVVPLDEAGLPTFDGRASRLVTTVLRVAPGVDFDDAKRALSRIRQDTLGTVDAVPEQRAFVVTDFAPAVADGYRALRRLEALPPPAEPRLEIVGLRRARAENVQTILLEQVGGALRVSADEATSQVIVRGSDRDVADALTIIQRLDAAPAGGR